MNDSFLSVLCKVMSVTAARQTIEESRPRQAEERERFRDSEESDRRTRNIGYDWDYNPFYHGQGGLTI